MRQFLALRLAPGWHEVLDERRRRLADALRGWRWARPGAVHLTLRFLGEVDERTDALARPAWAAATAARQRFTMRLGGLGTFPRGRRARVLWAGVDADDELALLAAELEEAARALGFAPQEREFRPHLTLARARRGGRPELPPEDPPALDAAPHEVREVILFQSVLDPRGARYTALESFPLSSG